MEGEILVNLANNLKKIRKDNDLSQEQLAEKLGVSRQAVSKWESNLAYPEMDKVLQICKMFEVDVDDLLNQDLREVLNSKQSRSNINKFIEDFLDYVKRTVDLFSSLKFKNKLKCIFEQAFIALILFMMFGILKIIGSSIVESIFSFLPANFYYMVSNIIEAVYLIICLVLGLVLLFYIFKIRYLDYYVVVPEKREPEEIVSDNKKKEEIIESKRERVIIRDPKHSGYKFISAMLSGLLFLIKIFAFFVAMFGCFSLIILVVGFVLSFLFIKNFIMFAGIIAIILALIIMNLLILVLIYNFIISKKSKKSRLAIIFVTSLVVFGIGIGIFSISITKFDYVGINDNDSKIFLTKDYDIKYANDLFICGYDDDVEYIPTDIDNLKVKVKYSNNYDLQMDYADDRVMFSLTSKEDFIGVLKSTIRDINNNKFVDYSQIKITVYASSNTIQKLKQNEAKYYSGDFVK